MNAVNMAAFTAPKTDQANYDDFIAGPRTITITGVRVNEGSKEQPISIHFEGDNGKPYKPCLSMRRCMVNVWGADASKYAGRSLTLYGDPDVIWGGMKVGGIRISHMSHIEKAVTMALTASKTKRAPFTVQPLVVPQAVDVPALVALFDAVTEQADFTAAEATRREAWSKLSAADKGTVKTASDTAKAMLASRIAETRGDPL